MRIVLIILLFGVFTPSYANTDSDSTKNVQLQPTKESSIEELKKYIAYLEALLEKNSVSFSKEAIQERKVIEQELNNKLLELKQKVEKRDKEIEAKKERNQILIIIAAIFILVVVPGILTFILRKNNKKQLDANKSLDQKNKNVEFAYEKITSSLNYANKIQRAIFVRKEFLDQHFNSSFIWFQPKEVVSNNFYWFGENEESIYVIAGECSNKGVAGAFLTMMSISFLSEIVQNNSCENSNAILLSIADKIESSKSGSTSSESEDDLSIGIIAFDKETNSVEFSGCNIGAFFKTNNGVEVIDSGNQNLMQTVKNSDNEFKSSTFSKDEIQEFYLTSNGIANQVNNKGEKFEFSKLVSIVENNLQNTIEEKIKTEVSTWMSNENQTEDILLLGVKI